MRYVKRGNPYAPRREGRERVEGRGMAPASREALAAWNRVSVECGRCGALRDWQSVARAAGKEGGRVSGNMACVCCSMHFRLGKDGQKQRERAREILRGDRLLVRQPASTSVESVWIRADARECAIAVLVRFGDA